MNRKRISILIIISILLIVIFASTYSYALFQSDISGSVDAQIASWTVKVNNSLINDGMSNSFTIDTINYTQTDSNVRSGKFAPGIEGYYDLEIDPNGTEVSVKYSIIIEDFEVSNLKVDRVELLSGGSTFTKVDDYNYSGIILLGNTNVQHLRLYLDWNDLNTKEANEEDSIIGTRDNPNINIPVTVNLIQYLGE